MFTVTLAFTSGPNKAKGKTVDDRLYWSPESDTAARIFAANLKVMGARQEWIMSDRPTPQQIAERCVGNVVSVRLKPDEFNGQATTRVNYQARQRLGHQPDRQGHGPGDCGERTSAAAGDGRSRSPVRSRSPPLCGWHRRDREPVGHPAGA
jgi:hypothetical protein